MTLGFLAGLTCPFDSITCAAADVNPFPDASHPPAAPIARARALRIGFGLVLGGFAFWVAIRDARVVELRAVLARAHLLWVLAALASVVLTVAVGVARWRVLFHPDEERPSWPNLAAALLIGQMLNIMLPLRLGEMARAYWLSRAEPMPIGRALGTIGIEKLADLTSLGVAADALLLLVSVPSWADAPGQALIRHCNRRRSRDPCLSPRAAGRSFEVAKT